MVFESNIEAARYLPPRWLARLTGLVAFSHCTVAQPATGLWRAVAWIATRNREMQALRSLLAMDERLLKDVGLTRHDVSRALLSYRWTTRAPRIGRRRRPN